MQALVYKDLGQKSLEDRPKPTIEKATDTIIKITKTTICGTDLHILKGDVPTCKPGTVLGHEGVGIVDEVGSGVVTSSWVTACSFHASPRVGVATIAARACTRIARQVAGY